DANAPASRGRHVRSSAGSRRIPARFSPRITRTTPPIWRSCGTYGDRPSAAKDAVTPSRVKTLVNPNTYARAWRKAAQRDGVDDPRRLDSATATAVSWPRYAGTSGRTQGLTKLSRPARAASRIEGFSGFTGRGSRRVHRPRLRPAFRRGHRRGASA